MNDTAPAGRTVRNFKAAKTGTDDFKMEKTVPMATHTSGSMDARSAQALQTLKERLAHEESDVDVASVAAPMQAPIESVRMSTDDTFTEEAEAALLTPSVPAVEESVPAGDDEQEQSPCFTCAQIEEAVVRNFTREYTSNLSVTDCVAEREMLLRYMVQQERLLGVTLPFRACGVDTVVFDRTAEIGAGGVAVVPVLVPADKATNCEEHTAFYETVVVDGIVFFSCLTDSLNPEYLHQIIENATDALYMHGSFVLPLVGLRPLRGRYVEDKNREIEQPDWVQSESGGESAEAAEGSTEETASAPATTFSGGPSTSKLQEFIETLKLNSFELSVFVNYMSSIPGVEVFYRKHNGRQAVHCVKRG